MSCRKPLTGSLPKRIEQYLETNNVSLVLRRYLQAAPREIQNSVDEILKISAPNPATLKQLVELACDLNSRDGNTPLGDRDFVRLIRDSGIKDAVKRLRKLRTADVPVRKPKEAEAAGSAAASPARRVISRVNRGNFIKPCPCSPGRLGCNYYIIVPGMGCPFNCSYCFLNFYSRDRDITVYSNTDDLLRELTSFIDSRKNELLRFGTGEFVDSMAIRELDSLNMELVRELGKRPNAVIEFKTKSTNIDSFLKVPPLKNVILSWSLNPQWIIDSEEKGTAPLKDRLYAAKKAVEHGYGIALHLDPIFMSRESLGDYLELVDGIFSYLPASSIKWLSMGGFRYIEELKLAILENNRGKKWFLGQNFTRCEDGKFRYPEGLRLWFYNKLGERIRSYGPVKTYLCMEGMDFWKGITFTDHGMLCRLHPAFEDGPR